MVFSYDDKVLIKNLYLLKGYGLAKLMSEFPDKNWKRCAVRFLRTGENCYITAWAVALSCYISHSAMHRKKADFDPQGPKTPEPILMKLGMVDYVRDPKPHANFGGVPTLRGWSRHIRDL